MNLYKQPWLVSPLKESTLILAPAILPVLIVFVFRDYFTSQQEVSTLWWLVLVVCIDVGHVYSTLFRLYWDPQTFNKYKKGLILIPVVGFSIGLTLHLYSSHLFWRVLAYVAAFHFVRQQYGFMRLYSRKENHNTVTRYIDSFAIYNATLYPLLYWHIHLTTKLSWFVPQDFVKLSLQDFDSTLKYIFLFILAVYIGKELWLSIKHKTFNVPKNLLVVGTYLSWYVGIVTFHGDLIFTLLNVVAHGIPYMALIWLYGENKSQSKFEFTLKGVFIFIGVLVALAYFEEGLWDIFVWKDHLNIFPFFEDFSLVEHPVLLSVIVATLVLPQITHYILDGFIWRFSKDSRARFES